MPAGVINVVTTDRSGEIVNAALEDDRVRKISFTGSTPVGRILLKKAADRVIASSMELGGNDPFLVLADADVDAAVDGAMIAKMRNGGQACTAANRFLVHRDVADEFATKLAARMGALKVGSGLEPGVELGPMVSEKAVAGIADLVDRSIAAGATALIGGTRSDGPGFFYPATVLTNVPPTHRSRPKRSSARSPRSSPSTPTTRRSPWPTPPSSASSATSTAATSPTDCGSASSSRSAWSASTAAWSPTRPRPSAASRNPASAAKAASRASTNTSRRSTSPPAGKSL